MLTNEKVNILLVDDQPAKLLSYEVVLRELGENLIQASSATEALQILLKNEIAVVLVDVCMPDLDGFELAAMIREHPRFQKTAIIFISAIHLTEADYLRGYDMGGADYVDFRRAHPRRGAHLCAGEAGNAGMGLRRRAHAKLHPDGARAVDAAGADRQYRHSRRLGVRHAWARSLSELD